MGDFSPSAHSEGMRLKCTKTLLSPQTLNPEESLAYLPAELWWDSIALLIQCFPGLTPGAFCADLGDAPPLALHSVFEPAIDALENAGCERSKSQKNDPRRGPN